MSSDTIPTYLPHYDYVRLTTWDEQVFAEWVYLMRQKHGAKEFKAGRFMQYKGVFAGSWFVGQGKQTRYKGQTDMHYLIEVKGYDSDEWKDTLNLGDSSYTRVDYCVTVKLPVHWRPLLVADSLQDVGLKYGGSVGLETHAKADGATVRLGKRGDKGTGYYYRWYEKATTDRKGRKQLSLLRFELEVGSRGIEKTGTDRGVLAAMMTKKLDDLPAIGNGELWGDAYYTALNETLAVISGEATAVPKVMRRQTNTYEWLAGTVKSSMLKFATRSVANKALMIDLLERMRQEVDAIEHTKTKGKLDIQGRI